MSSYAAAFLILAEKVDLWKDTLAQMEGHRRGEWEQLLREAGVTKLSTWLQHTDLGDFEIVYCEAEDPAKWITVVATADNPICRFLRQRMLEMHGFDISKELPQRNELIYHIDIA